MLDLEFAQFSDAGRTREQNEDYHGCVEPASGAQARTHGWLFVLADGVGGHEGGEIASRLAVETLLNGFRAARAGEPLTALLPRLVQAANTRVLETGMATGTGGAPMATTVVACALRFDCAVIAHAGDSRCYLVRRGDATLLTRDHTVAGEQVRLGIISSGEAVAASTRHVLSRALGAGLFVNVDISAHSVQAGDVLLLCSDGLHGSVDIPDIIRLTSHSYDLNDAARDLVALANERDGGDNITVQLIRVRSVERVGMYRGRPYKLQ